MKPLGPVATQRLEAAAGLLRNGWGVSSIRPAQDETYAQAVLRTIRGMPEADQARLKSLVDWVQDYGFDDEPPRAVVLPVRPAPVTKARSEQAVSSHGNDFEDGFDPEEDAVLQALASVEGAHQRPR